MKTDLRPNGNFGPNAGTRCAMTQTNGMNRREFQTATALAALQCCLAKRGFAATENQAKPSKPNIVLIMADDLGYECLSCNGSAAYQTPVLDGLAETGARFTHCYVNPLCTPTRAAIMTGKYNYRNFEAFGLLRRQERTFAQRLKECGYATAVAGKWQLDYDPKRGQSPFQSGFDAYCLWNIAWKDGRIANDRYADANLLRLNRATGQAEPLKVTGEYGPEVCAEYLLDFMDDSVKKGTPFFAYYPMILTHSPFTPSPRSPEWRSGDRHEDNNRFFKDMVESMDDLVGRIVAKLDELGIRNNTLILFTGDNGTHINLASAMQDGSTINGGKGKLNDAGTHVPLVANWPGKIPSGRTVDDLVSVVDFLPTMMEASGSAITPEDSYGCDGVSFYPALLGESYQAREWVMLEYYESRGVRNRQEGRFIRNHRWKLYGVGTSPCTGKPLPKGGELYDLANDPGEQKPIQAGQMQEADAIRKEFEAVLAQHATA